MGAYGEVEGAYIVRKWDKGGNKFGFMMFKNVRDRKGLEWNLRDLKMGGYKLISNVVKFALENQGFVEQVGQKKPSI
ncbi:hypothetical protein Hanom_Chr04g00347671 [Helianthus anomalus]